MLHDATTRIFSLKDNSLCASLQPNSLLWQTPQGLAGITGPIAGGFPLPNFMPGGMSMRGGTVCPSGLLRPMAVEQPSSTTPFMGRIGLGISDIGAVLVRQQRPGTHQAKYQDYGIRLLGTFNKANKDSHSRLDGWTSPGAPPRCKGADPGGGSTAAS